MYLFQYRRWLTVTCQEMEASETVPFLSLQISSVFGIYLILRVFFFLTGSSQSRNLFFGKHTSVQNNKLKERFGVQRIEQLANLLEHDSVNLTSDSFGPPCEVCLSDLNSRKMSL